MQHHMMDDADLLRAYAQNRSEPAFAEFVERRVGFVYATALRMVSGDAHTAQDVAQAVFVLAANRADALATHGQLAGWLHTTTRNVSCKAVREAQRRAAREQEAARMNAIENDIADTHVTHSDSPETLLPLLDEALGALREGEREAVLLRFFEGKAFAEIGVKLSMSEESARKRVARGVEKMRAAFARRGVTSSAAALGALMTAEAASAAPAGLAASVSAGAMSAAAAGATVAGTAGAILTFMASTKITAVAVVALLVAASGVYYGVQNARESAASLAQARHENETLAARLRALGKRGAAAGGASASAPKLTPWEAGQKLMAEHPEIRETQLAMNKAFGAGQTFRIARTLHLTPEQSDRLAEIHGWLMAGNSLRSPFGAPSITLPGYGPVILDIGGLTSDEAQTAIHALLGDANYEKYQQLWELCKRGDDARQTKELSARLYLTDAPLTSQQAWSIDEIIYDLRRNLPDETEPEARWKLFQERAGSVLSPEQMKAFADVSDRNIYEQTRSKAARADAEAARAERTGSK